ncbi:30S ribosomal protein S20 [Patescibacteria group bacterium]|nr:30S ribosomal protein S20 [Patescibacteria group bacterium]MBU4453372.1 30S ribosomal protein S20 [Patescibacteria group bacterium]MCG2687933.1 30S ribosomal protein S20 [Candidatus Parcubacteria bacterium]
MPNLANAKKALRQSKKRYERNKIQKSELESFRRQLRKSVEAKKSEEAESFIKKINQLADKMVSKDVLKKNTASRIKSRSVKMLSKVK